MSEPAKVSDRLIALRPELENKLLYFPVSDLVAGGFIESKDIVDFIGNHLESREDERLRSELNGWFGESRERLTKIVTEILDEHWPR